MVEPPMDSGPGGGEPTITLVTPGAAALASFNASNDVEARAIPRLIETAINSSSFTSKAKRERRETDRRGEDGRRGEASAVKSERARVAEEKRKVKSRLAKKNWDDDTTTSTSRNVLKEKICLNVQNKDKTVNAAKSKMKNGLEMVSHVMIPYETTKREQRYDSKERNRYWCDMYLFASEFVVCGVRSRKRMRGYRVREGRVERTKEDESVCAAAKVRDE